MSCFPRLTRSDAFRTVLSFLACACLLAHEAGAETPIDLRQPALSSDGTKIAFAWRGDLWIAPWEGGRATQVTRDPIDERRPLWTPDGRALVYAARRSGNYDLFVRDLEGDAPRQLTFHESDDWPSSISSDGRWALFHSRREREESRLYRVPIKGGEVEELTEDESSDGVLSPDGRAIAFVHGEVPWWRRGYRGAASADLWIYDLARGRASRITDLAGQDLWPQWFPDGKSLLYASEETFVSNLYRVDLVRGERTRLTGHTGDGVRFPSLSADGRRVVYEAEGRIWGLDLSVARSEPAPIPIELPRVERMVVADTLVAGAREVAACPGSDRVVVTLGGDLWLAALGQPMRALTTGDAREREPALSHDGKTLFYSGDASGNFDLYRMELDGGAPRPFRDAREDERAPCLSPNDRVVAYLRAFDGDELRLADADGGRDRLLARGPRFAGFAFSPDSRWIAFARADAAGQFDIFVLSLVSEEAINLTRHPAQDLEPRWSPDGNRLYFLSDRSGVRELWQIPLNGRGTDAADELSIDLDGIIWRAEPVPTLRGLGDRYEVSSDGLFYDAELSGARELFHQPWGELPERWTRGGFDPRDLALGQGNVIALDRGGALFRIEARGATAMPFRAMQQVDQEARFAQMLDEAWRALRDGFYDRGLHLINWDAMRERYRARLPGCATREELSDLMRMMSGELNASHLGEIPAEEPRPRSAWLGVEVSAETGSDGVRIERVVPRGPIDRLGLSKGDRILAINGVELGREMPIEAALLGQAGEVLSLRVRAGRGARTESVLALETSTGDALLDEARTTELAAKVRKRTRGAIAYLRLARLEPPEIARFEREVAELPSECRGILLDLRGNPGGFGHQEVMDLLSRRATLEQRERGEEWVYSPALHFDGALVALISEGTGSAAELLAESIRASGRGRLVGRNTFGGVISAAEIELGDGARLRIPRIGWSTLDGKNLENRGVAPDVECSYEFEEEARGEDPVLWAAIRELERSEREER